MADKNKTSGSRLPVSDEGWYQLIRDELRQTIGLSDEENIEKRHQVEISDISHVSVDTIQRFFGKPGSGTVFQKSTLDLLAKAIQLGTEGFVPYKDMLDFKMRHQKPADAVFNFVSPPEEALVIPPGLDQYLREKFLDGLQLLKGQKFSEAKEIFETLYRTHPSDETDRAIKFAQKSQETLIRETEYNEQMKKGYLCLQQGHPGDAFYHFGIADSFFPGRTECREAIKAAQEALRKMHEQQSARKAAQEAVRKKQKKK